MDQSVSSGCDNFDMDQARALACAGPRGRGHRRGRCIESKQASGAKRPVVLVGAADEIAPFDNAAFENRTGELIGRSARIGSRKRRRASWPRYASAKRDN